MSKMYEAMRQLEREHRQPGAGAPELVHPMEMVSSILAEVSELTGSPSAKLVVSPAARLVALTDPQCLGAEKFRALVTRLENLRWQRELKSLQVTSGLMNEGKTLVAANLAVTFAKSSGTKVLLIEGDLHRPILASLFGLTSVPGLVHWWSSRNQGIAAYLRRLDDMSLWFLGAGTAYEQPAQILQSTRWKEEFTRLAGLFDWIVVDSTPMLPVADANLWSRLVDGTLLVVREGAASVKALKTGLASLDNPNLVGVVLNEASELDPMGYEHQYYAPQNSAKTSRT